MLEELLEHIEERDVIMASVWQIFGILLEYCARGEFILTVNVLEKRRAEMESSLKKIILD